MPFQDIETPVQARIRHLKNIDLAIQSLEKRLMKAGAKPFGERTTPTDDTELNELDHALGKVQTLKEEILNTAPKEDESVAKFTSNCNHFIEQTSGHFNHYNQTFAEHKTAFDYLVECINPLLEYFGFEKCQTTSFKNTLHYMKDEAETMQDQEQIDKTEKWEPPAL
jgi:hypothetical protein